MFTRSSVPRRAVVSSFLAAFAVLLLNSDGGAGVDEVIPFNGVFVAHTGTSDSSSEIGGILTLHDGAGAKKPATLDFGAVTNIAGFWKTKAPETVSADFTDGFEVALELASGHPAKCKVMKMPEIVQANGLTMGSVRSEYKAVAAGQKVKTKLHGFFVST